MIIKKLYISSFGNIKNLELNLENGLNSILQDNGWGKSTIASFIKAMFYGLVGDRIRDIKENERVKFRPWNSTELFGGYVEFTWKDKELKIERYFGAKASEDTVKLFDVISGREFSQSQTENLGERILQINEQGFCSTTYFSQKDLVVKENSSISSKYNQVFDVTSLESFEIIEKRLDNKAKIFKAKNTATKGLIADTKQQILELNSKLEGYKKEESFLAEINIKIAENNEQIDQLNKEIEDVTQNIISANKAEAIILKQNQLNDLVSESQDLKQKINSYKKALNNNTISNQEITDFKSAIIELNKAEGAREIAEEQFNANTMLNKPNKNNNYLIAILLSVVIVACSIPLFFINTIAGGIVLGIGVISTVLSIILTLKTTSNNGEQISKNNALELKLNEYNEICNGYKNVIEKFLDRFNIAGELDYLSKFNLIIDYTSKVAELEEKLKSLNLKISTLNSDADISVKTDRVDVGLLDNKLSALKQKLNLFINENTQLILKQKIYRQHQDEFIEIQNDKQNLEENLIDYVRQYDLLTITLNYFRQANENLKVKYRAPLQQAFTKYYSLIDGAKELSIDVDFNVTVSENGKAVNADYYSKGLVDLFEVCKRFALIDVLFDKEPPFVILDDPFVNLDGKKLELAKRLVKELSNSYQILYFSCHNSRQI